MRRLVVSIVVALFVGLTPVSAMAQTECIKVHNWQYCL